MPSKASSTSKCQKQKRAVVMAEFKRGQLHSGNGGIVKDPQQAVAIAYSEARKKCNK